MKRSNFAPETADGWSVYHQFFKIKSQDRTPDQEKELLRKAQQSFSKLQQFEEFSIERGQSAAFHILGHKGQLMLLHFRKDFSDLSEVEVAISQLPISSELELHYSYVSVVELGMYQKTKSVIESLMNREVKPFSEEWNEEYKERTEGQKENLLDRRFCPIPSEKYFCFYPMNKKRSDQNNWYREALQDRADYMMEHGMTGRRFAGKVHQIISGSIGFDDWEWGVDLFAKDPLDIKRLVYEMRFDDATSLFGEFGPFYFGIRVPFAELADHFFSEKSL